MRCARLNSGETCGSSGSFGVSTSRAVDSEGNPHIAHTVTHEERVVLATWTRFNWQSHTLDEYESYRPEITLEHLDQPHVLWTRTDVFATDTREPPERAHSSGSGQPSRGEPMSHDGGSLDPRWLSYISRLRKRLTWR